MMGRGLLDALLDAIVSPSGTASQLQNVPATVKAVLARHGSEDVCAALQAAIASPRAKVCMAIEASHRLVARSRGRGGKGAIGSRSMHATAPRAIRHHQTCPQELLRHVLTSTRPDSDMPPEEVQRWQELRSRLACAMVGWLAGVAACLTCSPPPAIFLPSWGNGRTQRPLQPAPSPPPGPPLLQAWGNRRAAWCRMLCCAWQGSWSTCRRRT